MSLLGRGYQEIGFVVEVACECEICIHDLLIFSLDFVFRSRIHQAPHTPPGQFF